MKRIRLGICLDDQEYEERLGKFLMNHYMEQLELFLFTDVKQLESSAKQLEVLLVSDNEKLLDECLHLDALKSVNMISLAEGNDHRNENNKIHFVDKYQDVNRIVDEIMKQVGTEVEEVMQTGTIIPQGGIYAIYSLAANEYQLPFAVTTGAVFAEKRQVLFLDLQENSGLSQLMEERAQMGLEELLVMASVGKFSRKRIQNCIGHIDKVEFVYPTPNSENICEMEKGIYRKLIHMLIQEMNYDIVVVNLGSRFSGFFEFLDKCDKIYLLTCKTGPGKWREEEFYQEMEHQGYPRMKEKVQTMEIPPADRSSVSCQGLIERWKWTEVGKKIREQQEHG